MSQVIKEFNYSGKPRIIDWSRPVESVEEVRERIDEEYLALEERKRELRAEIAAGEERRQEIEAEIGRRLAEADRSIEEVNEQASRVVEDLERQRLEFEAWRREEQEKVQREARKIREDASQEGFTQGREEGREVAAGKAIALLTGLEQSLARAIREKDSVIVQAEKQILELALAIARKIVRTEIRINPAVIDETVKCAIARVTDRDSVTVYVNLQDLERVTRRRGEILRHLDPGSRVTVVEDENIEPGGLIISTQLGNIDATIRGQELEIDRVLRQIHEEPDSAETE